MAIPFTRPSEEEADNPSQEQLEQLMLDLYSVLQQVIRARNAQHQSRNHRLPRRSDEDTTLIDADLSRTPLPDLVLSAMQQLPSTSPPQVTVSAPSSPTRDAAFQFPECGAGSSVATMISGGTMPVPSPRPKPRRRRLTSEGSLPEKIPSSPLQRQFECSAAHGTCCAHRWWSYASLDEREWATVGAGLRNIADDFHANKAKDAENEKLRFPFLPTSLSTSRSNLISATTSPIGSTDNLLSMLIPGPVRETLWTTLALYLGWRLVSRLR